MKKSIIYNYTMEVKSSDATISVYEVQGINNNIITATKEEFIHFIEVQPEVLKRLKKTNEGFKAFIRFDV